MKAELREIYVPEADLPLSKYLPDDPADFGVRARLDVSSEGVHGSDAFELLICTPSWIQRKLAVEEVTWGRHLLIVAKFNFARIHSEIQRYLNGCEGTDWEEIARKISRVAVWEFEDYHPYGPPAP